MTTLDEKQNTAGEYEHRTIGPPGCGKTTWLGEQIEDSVKDDLIPLVTSLTRTSAAAITSHELELEPQQVGTLHSHCYRLLGGARIAESRLQDWNESYPEYRMGNMRVRKPRQDDEEEDEEEEERINEQEVNNFSENRSSEPGDEKMTPGDVAMNELQRYRSRMITNLPSDIAAFAHKWNQWKDSSGLMDFTDLIEVALRDYDHPPENPDIIYVDEAQDMDLLELTLLRHWGKSTGHLVMVGDPDQNIYRWRGADPLDFVGPVVSEERRQVLSQSYRVPHTVHDIAINLIRQNPNREDVQYNPTQEQGEVRKLSINFKQGRLLVTDAEQYLKQNKTVMFITSCNHMLNEIINALRENGIPYHNPYRINHGAWNPLPRTSNRTSSADRIMAYLALAQRGGYTAEELEKWIRIVDTRAGDVLAPKMKKNKFKDMVERLGPHADAMDFFFESTGDGAQEAALTGDLEWLAQRLVKSKKDSCAFPLEIVKRRGTEALEKQPQVIVGSIHSVKGGEADAVYLFPDISRKAQTEIRSNPFDAHPALRRLFYVGITRAKESLILCTPENPRTALRIT